VDKLTAQAVHDLSFTEASARAALVIAEREVMALQRFIKRMVELEILWPLIQQAGLDPEGGLPTTVGTAYLPKIGVSDMLKAFELGVINRKEPRSMLQRSEWELQAEIGGGS